MRSNVATRFTRDSRCAPCKGVGGGLPCRDCVPCEWRSLQPAGGTHPAIGGVGGGGEYPTECVFPGVTKSRTLYKVVNLWRVCTPTSYRHYSYTLHRVPTGPFAGPSIHSGPIQGGQVSTCVVIQKRRRATPFSVNP